MNNIRNEVGNATEKNVSLLFRECGYWAYVLPKKIGGQPFDVIGCRLNNVWFVDGKHLEKEKASFSFDRIEPNQKTSMAYAHKFARIRNLGFVIEWERTGKLYFFHYLKYIEMEANGEKSVKIEELEEFKDLLCVEK